MRCSFTGAVLLVAVLIAGCANKTPMAELRPYPSEKPSGPTANIQVVRIGTMLELTNTTATSFGASTLWLNQSYRRDIDKLDIGESLSLRLKEFRNEFAEPFRAGGFFATERPKKVVKVELETETRRIGFVVVGDETEG